MKRRSATDALRRRLVAPWLLAAALAPVGCREAPTVDAACPETTWTAIRSPAVERVVLVTLDTLRADHLSAYGYRIETSPFLDSLAAAGVRFATAISSSPETAPSHASIFTGMPPSEHGVRANGERLSGNPETLACAMARAGYETAAFTAAEFLRPVAVGFQTFAGKRHGPGLHLPAEEVVARAVEWIEGRSRSGRFFLWVHLFDVHQWHRGARIDPADLRAIRQLRGDPARHYRYIADLHGLGAGEAAFDWSDFADRSHGLEIRPFPVETPADVVRFVDRYDAQIRRVDRGLRTLWQAAERRSFEGATLWVVAGDHGEGLGSHGYHGHDRHLYEEQLRVPLVLWESTGRFAGHVETSPVRLVDLMPTLAGLAGMEQGGKSLDGQSLLPILQGAEEGPRIAFSERRPVDNLRLRVGWSDEGVYSLRIGDAKLIRRDLAGDEYYDLRRDPLEARPLPASEWSTPRAVALRTELEARLERLDRSSDAAPETAVELDPEIAAELRALGYLE